MLQSLRDHAEEDCPRDEYHDIDSGECLPCSEDKARFYSALLGECLQCGKASGRYLDASGVCAALTPCGKGEYIKTRPTKTTDKVCSALTVCKPDQFQSQPPGITTDRKCAALSTCKPSQEYEASPPLINADRVCKAYSPECDFSREYQASPPGVSTDRVCKPVTVCGTAELEARAPTETKDRLCKPKFNPAHCKDVLLKDANATTGVYEISPGYGVEPFKVHCDMAKDKAGGGWTLLAKIGAGNWRRLTNSEYLDLTHDPTEDKQPEQLLTEKRPVAGQTMAFFSAEKTNAIGRAAIKTSKNLVFLIEFRSRYYVQGKIGPSSDWEVWRAIRDATYWSTAPSKGEFVSNFGADFRLSADLEYVACI